MKKAFTRKRVLIGAGAGLFVGLLLFIFFEAFFNGNFRAAQDTIWSTHKVDLAGLRELKASGGNSLRFWDLKRRLGHIKENIIIVDGMSEYHGYVKGIPTTFFAYQHPKPHWKYYIRRLVFTGTTAIRPDLVTTEEEEAKKHGFFYFNVKVGSKFISSDQAIDDLVKIFDALPENAWVHFHCHYGKGRTSMMLAMYDIMKNAPKVKLEDIIKRQHLLGSEDLMNMVVRPKGSYTQDQLAQRKEFIENFYQFVCQRKAGGIQGWSEWKVQQK